MYDLVIIGGGPAGYSAALEAIRHNLKVAVFEASKLGGTCLNRGCVPTKYLSHLAKLYQAVINAENEGIFANEININFKNVKKRMVEIISAQRESLKEELADKGVDIIEGSASILGSSEVTCDGRIYEARNILIATGSMAAPPLISNAVTSDDLLRQDSLPDKVSILGGGSIAVEFAYIFRAFGEDVDIYIRSDRLLKNWDKEIAVGITQSLKKKGIRINKNVDFSELEINEGVILSANGRIPQLPCMPQDYIEVGPSGGIVVNKEYQTSVENIYAVGDVIEGSMKLAHVAMEQGRRAVRYMIGEPVSPEAEVIRCIHIDQEAASVGPDEKNAVSLGIDAAIGKVNMYSNARTQISGADRGFVKVLADKKNKKIVGAHLLCEHAGDIISELALGINEGLTISEMLRSIRPHPSYCEAVTEALRSVEEKLVKY